MKKVLSAVGKFFMGIVNWVKNTAWVQPLLIVGGIFALIMSIKPISNWIGDITNVTSESHFYDSKMVNYEKLVEKIDGTSEDTNKTLLVFYIQEENNTCTNCIGAEKPLENFFSLNHSELIGDRKYELAVIDIAADEFTEGEVDDDKLLDIREHIDNYGFMNLNEEEKFGNQSEFDWISSYNSDEPMPTPCIARFEDGKCVAAFMGKYKHLQAL